MRIITHAGLGSFLYPNAATAEALMALSSEIAPKITNVLDLHQATWIVLLSVMKFLTQKGS